MTAINTTTSTATTTQTTSTANTESAAQQTSGLATTGDEFNNFLELLTAQIRNQDPLEPLDSTQFVEQLATFSTLEQQVQSNTRLDTIAATLEELYTAMAPKEE
jgi:flagellar basal-body rod modification protein FlgD